MERKPSANDGSPMVGSADQFWLASIAQQQYYAQFQSAQLSFGQSLDARVRLRSDVIYTATVEDGNTSHRVWKIRDISMTGVFVEMDVSSLRDGAIVDFVLRYHLNGIAKTHRLSAKVVRFQLNGAGLRFGCLNPTTFRDLLALLHGR